jgi:four helix bundle protein
MEKTNFEKLDIYQLAEAAADQVWDIVAAWSRLAQRTVGEQVIRSADSIGANIAEGSGRGTATDNRRFLRMARGSLYETRHWLRRAFKRRLLTKAQTDALSVLLAELTPKLNAYIRRTSETVRNERRGTL